MKILYAAQLAYGSTSFSRMQALADLGHELIPLDYNTYFIKYPSLLQKLQHELKLGPAINRINSEILKLDLENNPDIVWIDKGVYVTPETVKKLKLIRRYFAQPITFHI